MTDQARQTAESVAASARDTVDQVQRQASDLYEKASSWASDQYESASRQLGSQGRRSNYRARGGGVERFIQDNPVLVGVLGLATGLVLGALLPRTRHEDRAFGEWADEVREQGLRYARDMTQRGREYVEEAFNPDDEDSATQAGGPRGAGQGGAPGRGGQGGGATGPGSGGGRPPTR